MLHFMTAVLFGVLAAILTPSPHFIAGCIAFFVAALFMGLFIELLCRHVQPLVRPAPTPAPAEQR